MGVLLAPEHSCYIQKMIKIWFDKSVFIVDMVYFENDSL